MKGVTTIADATCLACGCLCDDISLSVAGDRIVKAERACPIGERWFLADRAAKAPVCLIDGAPAPLDAGYARASAILSGAKSPLFIGLGDLTCEAQQLAIGLADRLGGCIDTAHLRQATGLAAAFQSVGMVTATLGEVRHRADLVIFWGVDPATTHPRHFERYSLEPRGEFIPNGRTDRTCVVIDSRRTPTADVADVSLEINAGADGIAIDILRAIVEGSGEFDAAATAQQTGVLLNEWHDLAGRMKSARYGVIFFDAASASEAMLTLVRDMNRHTRFVCLPLGAAGNDGGAKQVLAWQTGYSGTIDFSDGYARPGSGAPAPDAALVFACDSSSDALGAMSTAQRECLIRIPCVVLHAADVSPPQGTAVAIAVATPGIHVAGTVFRCDGVPLPLRPVLMSPLPTTESALAAIRQALDRP